MLWKMRNLLGIISLGFGTLMYWNAPAFGGETVNVCNQGNVEVFFASLGVRESFWSDSGIIQGLFSIEPSNCRDVTPGDMSDVVTAFFYEDKAGTFGNIVFNAEGPEKSIVKAKLSQICVHPEGFRETSAQDDLSTSEFIKKWTPPCPKGYFPAKASFGAWGEKDYFYTIDISPFHHTLVSPFPPLLEN